MEQKTGLRGTEVQEKALTSERPGTILQFLLILLGFISLGVGIAGIFLPLVPTTPLVLLAAACFLKSSEKLYSWITNHKTFGKYIHNYLQSGRVPAKSKPISIMFVWICISISAYFAEQHWLKIVLILIACAVSIHLALLKTTESTDSCDEERIDNHMNR